MKMKRFISVTMLSILLAFSSIVFASAGQVTSNSTGFTNVSFSNGYYGFCIDQKLQGAYSGDSFTPAEDTTVAKNNLDNRDVSQKLKIFFTQCFEDIFVSDGNGGYVIDSNKSVSSVPTAIYHFSDGYEGQYLWGESKTFVEKVNAYDGPEIPDEGYKLKLENGDVVTFYFAVMEPQKEGQQSFFAYKLEVSQDTGHEHDYGEDWESDDTNHWHECECGDKADLGKHDGNTADCKNSSVCEVCGKQLSDADPDNHTGETEIRNAKPATEYEEGYTGDTHCKDCGKLLEKGEVIPATHKHSHGEDWKSDDTNHWHECECGDKVYMASHSVVNGVCSVCGKSVATDNKDNSTNIDFDGAIDFITGLLPGFDNNEEENADSNTNTDTDADENIATEIPSTGSESSIGFVYAVLVINMIAVIVTVSRKKKYNN